MMESSRLESEVDELIKQISGINYSQHKKLADLAEKTHQNRKKLEKSVNNLQESLDYLRICIKYQLFDLDATRRENEYLKKMLEENNR